MKTLAGIIAVLVMILSAGSAQPFQPGQGPGIGRMQGGPDMDQPDIPDLTAEQREKLETIRQDVQKTIIPIRAQIELKQIDMQAEMRKDNPDKAKIMKIAREVSDLELKIKEAHIDERLKINSVLTPEQREQMETMVRHRKIMKRMMIEEND